MITLTWTSMNIDAFKQHVQGGLQKLEALISSVNDIIENRINKNLKLVSNTLLVDLPADKSMLLEEFVALQEQHVKARTAMLQAKNQEVENAVEDVFNLITAYPLDPHVGEVDPGEVQRVKAKVCRSLHPIHLAYVHSHPLTSLLPLCTVQQPLLPGDAQLHLQVAARAQGQGVLAGGQRRPLPRAALLRGRRAAGGALRLPQPVPGRHPAHHQQGAPLPVCPIVRE